MRNLPIRLRYALLPLLTLWLAGLSGTVLAADRRVAVRPFEVYNAGDLEASLPGLQAAVASRLTAPGCQVITLKPGETPTGDWVVRVTLTRVGSRMSVDGAAEPAFGPGEVFRAYEIAESTDGLLPALTTVATTIRKGILSSPLPASRPAAPAAPTAVAPTAPSAPAFPTQPLPATAPQPPLLPGAESAPAFPTEPGGISKTLATYRYTAPVSGVALSFAVGDVDRDGSPELLVLTATEIIAFRDDGKEMKEQRRGKLGKTLRPFSLSVGDVDGDGIPEIIVAGVRGEQPASDVYQWASGALALHGPPVPAFARAVQHPDKGLLLLGMTSGGGHLFSDKLRSYRWSNGEYQEQGVFPTPATVLVTDVDWHRFKEGQPPWTVQTTQNDILKIFDEAGKTLFMGGDEIKGSENVLESEDRVAQAMLDPEIYRFQGKTVLWRDGAGTAHLLLQKNFAFTTAFKRSRSYNKGQLLAFRWEGLGLAPAGQSVKLPGVFADIDSGPSTLRPGATTLYAVLNQSEGILLSTKTLRVLAWDL